MHAGSRRRATVFNRLRDFAIHALGLLAAAGLLADQVGVAAWLLPLAILPLLWVRSARADDDHRPYSYPAPVAPDQWLDEARASYGRGTHISTLAVRYGVEPEWLEEKLGRGPT